VRTPHHPHPDLLTRRRPERNNSSKRLRSVKKIKTKKKKKYLLQREHDRWVPKHSAARRERDYDKWFKVRGKLHEADVERKNQIKTVADFLK